MRVVATAGHVDHGKSTLVRALTGTDPDRWAAEHSRGLTIDLGFAHTTLDTGETVAFVDVPGHQRFIANMLAGLGPAPAVLLVIAADEGWRAQTSEHLAAIDALGITHGLLVITRCDLADPSAALAEARERLAGTSLAAGQAVAVSATTGTGLAELRTALGRLCAQLPTPDPNARARLWVDRAFTITGAGTVVTGTLEAGRLRAEDPVMLRQRPVRIRGLQSLGLEVAHADAVARVAVNLRGIGTDELARGDALLCGEWHYTETTDVRVPAGPQLPERLMVHVGTAAVEARVRPLGEATPGAPQHVRLTWHGPLPLQAGDRLVLRDPGRQVVLTGAVVLDVDPPPLTRRGAARQRAAWLADAPERIDLERELQRRGHATAVVLRGLGADPNPYCGPRVGEVLVSTRQWQEWVDALAGTVREYAARHPLQRRMPMPAAADAIGVPEHTLVPALAAAAGLIVADGQLAPPDAPDDLGPAEQGLCELERRLATHPFRAPEHDDLIGLGLGVAELAAAVRIGRLLNLGEQVVLLPDAPARAMRELAALPQPFTTSAARQCLDTTRRVVIPLLEHLDRRGWTRRVDAAHREVVS